MSIAGYAGWPAYDTFFIVSLSSRPVYDPNPLRHNPNPKKPVSSSCRVRGLGRTLTPLLRPLSCPNHRTHWPLEPAQTKLKPTQTQNSKLPPSLSPTLNPIICFQRIIVACPNTSWNHNLYKKCIPLKYKTEVKKIRRKINWRRGKTICCGYFISRRNKNMDACKKSNNLQFEEL